MGAVTTIQAETELPPLASYTLEYLSTELGG